MRILIGALVVGLLAGCSTSPVTETTGKLVEGNRIYERSYVAPISVRQDKATVTFLRDSGYMGSGCS